MFTPIFFYKSKLNWSERAGEVFSVFMLLPPVQSKEEDFGSHHRSLCYNDSGPAGHDHRPKSKCFMCVLNRMRWHRL